MLYLVKNRPFLGFFLQNRVFYAFLEKFLGEMVYNFFKFTIEKKAYYSMKKLHFALIYLSFGQGVRFDPELPKQYHLLNDKPIALHSLMTFQSMKVFSEIIIVCHKEFETLFPHQKNILFTEGGSLRQDSVRLGFSKLTKAYDYVCIHDAARPYTHPEDIKRLLEASTYPAAALAIKATDTIKEVSENNLVQKTLNRKNIVQMQTPQMLRYDILKQGLDYIQEHHITITDDVQMAELLNVDVKIIEAQHPNSKITYLRDLVCPVTK